MPPRFAGASRTGASTHARTAAGDPALPRPTPPDDRSWPGDFVNAVASGRGTAKSPHLKPDNCFQSENAADSP